MAAETVGCPYARRLAAEFSLRLRGTYEADPSGASASRVVWGWRMVATDSGRYDGLEGSRTVFRRGQAKIRVDDRGE